MDKIDVDLQKLYTLINEEAKKIGTNIEVNKKQTLICLKKIKKEIDKKYKETMTLWDKSVKLYSEFLEKAPGSQQMKPPAAKPTLPESVDIVKGYIDMFESISGDKIMLLTNFVEKMYLDSIRGISDIRKKRDAMMVAMSGFSMDMNG